MSNECKRKFGVEEIGSYRDFEKVICKDCGEPYSIHRGLECPIEKEIKEASPFRDGLCLRLRNAIADKEWTIACANMETARGGWTCDWYSDMRRTQEEIDSILKEMKA